MKCSFPKQHLTSVTVWRPKSTRVSLAGLLSATSISSTGVSILHSGQIRKHHVEEKPPIRDFWPEFRQVQTLEMVVIYEKFGPCNADGQQSSKCISIQKGPLVIICQGDWWADKSQLNIPFFQTNFHQKKEVNNTSIHPTTLRPIDPLLNFSQASVPLLHLPGPLPELLPARGWSWSNGKHMRWIWIRYTVRSPFTWIGMACSVGTTCGFADDPRCEDGKRSAVQCVQRTHVIACHFPLTTICVYIYIRSKRFYKYYIIKNHHVMSTCLHAGIWYTVKVQYYSIYYVWYLLFKKRPIQPTNSHHSQTRPRTVDQLPVLDRLLD